MHAGDRDKENGTTVPGGTDIEFTKIGGRQYALAGSYRNGLQIVDITVPGSATVVGEYECNVTQGDVQVFRQDDEPGRTFATGAARKPPKEKQGKWMSGSEAQSYFAAQKTKLEPGYQLFCLTGGNS